ncbi:MAG: hypothetical protein LBC49_05550 [Bacteroidales bacterium]|jgi:hypothetical protein|nr:hypothetical protein [Bacteroidales bacterium]
MLYRKNIVIRIAVITAFIFISSLIYSQQYNSVFIERDSIDINNHIYKTGTAFVFDYEIIRGNDTLKLKYNNSNRSAGKPFDYSFEYANINDSNIGIDKIVLLVKEIKKRTNENQTQIFYLQRPDYPGCSGTGVVENSVNVWLHPIRDKYFSALQACPFPYIKRKVKIGGTWKDAMLIGYGSSENTGEWKGRVVLHYTYKIVGKKTISTKLGDIETSVIESKAKSKYFTTYLTSYFSEIYGFVRLEYTLVNGIKINFWIDSIEKEAELHPRCDFFNY